MGRRRKGLGGLQQEPTGIWTVRAYINGKRVSKSTGTKDRKEAEKFAADYLRPYVKGDAQRTYDNIQALVESDEKRKERMLDELPQLTLADAWEAYVKTPNRRDLSDATLEGKQRVWLSWVKWMGEHFKEEVELRQVSVKAVEAYLAYMRQHNSASTYNNRLCVLREIFHALQRQARAYTDPWVGIKLRADDSHSRRELTIEEIKRLAAVASRTGDEYRKLFAIGIYTGLRLGDCCRLNWKSVDVVRSIIQLIPSKTRKYSHGRPITIPIHTVLHDVLCETPESRRIGPVLPGLNKLYESKNGRPEVSRRVTKIFRNDGIVTSVNVEGRKFKAPEATFHSLRHTFVSMSANAGVPLHIVQSIVGHESTAMTRHYYHENETALRQAVAAIPSIGETQCKGAVYRQQRLGSMEATGVEYFPDELQSDGYVEPSEPAPTVAPVQPLAQQINPPPPKPDWQTMTHKDVDPAFAKPAASEPVVAEVIDPPKAVEGVVIPPGAKVEIRSFGRVFVNGVSTGARVGGNVAQPKPPKQAWFAEVYRVWARRRHEGLLEGTMELVENGGYKFLSQLYLRNTVHDPEEACDACEAYLKGQGVLI